MYRCDCQLECHPAYATYTSCNRHTVRVVTYIHTLHYVCRRIAQALAKGTSTDLVSQPHLPTTVHALCTKACMHHLQYRFRKVVRVEHKWAYLCAVSLASTGDSSASPPPLCTTDTYKQGDVITYPTTLPPPKVSPTGMKTATKIVPRGTTLVAKVTHLLTIMVTEIVPID